MTWPNGSFGSSHAFRTFMHLIGYNVARSVVILGLGLSYGCVVHGPARVTPTRGFVTPWLYGGDTRFTLERWEQEGYFPVTIEGRVWMGQNMFRVRFAASPPAPFSHASAFGLSDAEYMAAQQEEATKGRCQISAQFFIDATNMQRSQATWVYDPYHANRCILPMVARVSVPLPTQQPMQAPVPAPPIGPSVMDAQPPPPQAEPTPRDEPTVSGLQPRIIEDAPIDPWRSVENYPALCATKFRRNAAAFIVCAAPRSRDACVVTSKQLLKALVRKLVTSEFWRAVAEATVVTEVADGIGTLCDHWVSARLPPPPSTDMLECVQLAYTRVTQACQALSTP
jgi:hypothetical protein